MTKFLGKRVFYTCDHEGCQAPNFSWGKNSVEKDEKRFCSARCADRQSLIDEKKALETHILNAEFISPKDIRRLGEIKSLLLSDGETSKLTIERSNPQHSFFVKRSMSGVTNRRRQ